jgi:hypothetical protein
VPYQLWIHPDTDIDERGIADKTGHRRRCPSAEEADKRAVVCVDNHPIATELISSGCADDTS